ncbi:MAG: transposase, partial [Treponema sp.]|nr:transposase [Treponema sp.]
GIDETSYTKGQNYITVVVNHDTGCVIWVHEKHGKDILKLFLEELTAEQRASIQCYSADGARWISETMEEYCPGAEMKRPK